MNITRKIEIAEQAVRSISQHDDADTTLRDAALKRLEGFIETERASMAKRIEEQIAEFQPKAK